MPKMINAKVKERCTRLVLDHLTEYPSLTAVDLPPAAGHPG